MAQPVERDRPVAEHLEPLRAAAPLERTDAGEQLVELERLREVVVRAGVEAAHHVLDGVARREHEDRRIPTFPPELGRDLEAVLLGKDDVEQDDVVLVHVGQHGAFVPVGGDVHHVPLFLQPLLDESGDLPVVLHDENLHDVPIYSRALNGSGTPHEAFFMNPGSPGAPGRSAPLGPGGARLEARP